MAKYLVTIHYERIVEAKGVLDAQEKFDARIENELGEQNKTLENELFDTMEIRYATKKEIEGISELTEGK